jgi:NADH dehydrogenase (ubiquinone) 1 alpha/beta subcomplex 1
MLARFVTISIEPRTLSILTRLKQINGSSHFSNDLGLDSLDTVEVVMAIEEVCQ